MSAVAESPLRERKLFNVVDRLNQVHEVWVADPNRPNPDEQYWDAVQQVIDTFRDGDIPHSCRALAEIVDALELECLEFDERPNQANLYPRDNFWQLRSKLLALRAKQDNPVRRPMETIAELCALPNMTHEQVARMWNFIDVTGKPMPWLVSKELKEPGSVLNNAENLVGDHWRHPDHQEAAEELAAKPDPRLKRKQREAEKQNQPCPETPEELFQQNVPAEQAAKMLQLPLSEVDALWKKFGADKEAGSEDDTDLEGGKSNASADELRAKAKELLEGGNTHTEAARQLGISPQKLTAILK